MSPNTERDAVLFALGGAVVVWLLFREKSAGQNSAASTAAPLTLPTASVPVQTYTIQNPSGGSITLPSYVRPSAVVLRSGRDLGRRSASNPRAKLPTCGCSGGSSSSSGNLFTSVDAMLASFAAIPGLTKAYAAQVQDGLNNMLGGA